MFLRLLYSLRLNTAISIDTLQEGISSQAVYKSFVPLDGMNLAFDGSEDAADQWLNECNGAPIDPIPFGTRLFRRLSPAIHFNKRQHQAAKVPKPEVGQDR